MAKKNPFDYDPLKEEKQREHYTEENRETASFTSKDWEELCQSIAELGTIVSAEVGRGLKEGIKELKEVQKEWSKSQQTHNDTVVESVRQSKRKVVAQTTTMATKFSDSVKNGLLLTGGVLSVLCAVGTGIATLSIGLLSIPFVTSGLYWFLLLLLIFCTAGFFALGDFLLSSRGRRIRFRRYMEVIGEQTSVSLKYLSNAVQRSKRFVRKDLSYMIRHGWLTGAYLDKRELRFFDNIEEYQEPECQQQENSEKQTTQQSQEEHESIKEEQTILKQGQQFLVTLEQHIKATKQDAQINEELCRMRDQIEDLLGWLESHPECAAKLRKFALYYMPTILKLLDSYDDVKNQQGDVAEQIRLEIAGILHTMNIAFENLRDDLLSDTALDISTEISAMQSMLAQDGFSVDDNFYPKEQRQ